MADPPPNVRSVLCEHHGLRYNPATHNGCARCRSNLAAPSANRKKPTGASPLIFWGLVGAAALVVAAVFVLGGGPSQDGSSTQPVEAGSTATNTTKTTTSSGAPSSDAVGTTASTSDVAAPSRDSGWPTHEAVGEASIEDRPETETFLIDGKPAPDLRSLHVTARDGYLTVAFDFTQRLEDHAREIAVGIAVAAVFLDSDLNEKTGEKGFAGRHGFERAIVGYLGVRYDSTRDSYFWAGGMVDTPIFDSTCSHDVGTVSGYFLDATYDPGDEEALANTSCSGTTLTARVPYQELGVTAGQTVRIATEEVMGGGKVDQYFLDDVLLTLE